MFLLVPAHPGFPGQIPQSRKTVVCVCVVELVNLVTNMCLHIYGSHGYFMSILKGLRPQSVKCTVKSCTVLEMVQDNDIVNSYDIITKHY